MESLEAPETEKTDAVDLREVRLNRFLSMCGLGSRRECEKFVIKGKIKINGVVVKDLATRVKVNRDTVHLGDDRLTPKSERLYLVLNKPQGYTVSRKGFGEKTIFDLVRGMPANLAYAGRLDRESEGLLLLTTDGDLILRLTHPSYGVRKIYLADVQTPLSPKALERFRRGLLLEDGLTKPAQIDCVNENSSTYRIILKEGRNRQIRRMLDFLGSPVVRLKRIGFGPLRLEGLKPGEYRPLTERELRNLKVKLKFKPDAAQSHQENPAPFRYYKPGKQ